LRRIATLIVLALWMMAFGATPSSAQKAYVANAGANTVSVIDTTTNTVVGSAIAVGTLPVGVAVTPDGSQVYVTNVLDDTVSVIATASNTVTTIPVGLAPFGMAMTTDGSTVYVANSGSGTVSVIDTASNMVANTYTVGVDPTGIAVTPDGSKVYVANSGNGSGNTVSVIVQGVVGSPITVGTAPQGLAVTPDGSKVYVANNQSNNVSVIDTATETAAAPFAVGTNPEGVAVSPDGSTVYVTNNVSNNVSVIATSTNTVTTAVPVGTTPNSAAVTPDGTKVYVLNGGSIGTPGNTVSVISTANDMVTDTITVGSQPSALGNFIGPPTLTVAEAGTGAGQVTSSPANINCSASSNACAAMFPDGTQVTLTASAGAGSAFAGWSGGGCSGTSTCVITPTVDTTITATFNQVPSFTLSVAAAGTGSGTVTSNPSGINCGATCSASFEQGAQVTLTAVAGNGSTFAGWSGAGCSDTGTCQVTMNAAESVTATFTLIAPVTLTVAEAGTGAGQVTSSPKGINCSATSNKCSAPFAVGTQVTLTASASSGSSFSGWSGGGCGGTGSCVVTLGADTTVTATFKAKVATDTLSVTLTGGGSGMVTSSPSGINCGPTCSASFDAGTKIALSAAAASGSTFAGWSGGGCSGIDGCALTLDANTTVTASFVANAAGNLTLVAAVLPTSRSVAVGNAATTFATMIDAGPADAATCTIAPATGIPASFVFQTTDPTTNALTGAANTPANIAAGQAQSFVIALTPTAAFPPTNVAFTFTCANAPSPAASTVGVDTLNLSASTQPVPDIVALAASGDPGFVDIPGATGTGVFAVATVNLGIDATITAAANTGAANLPVTLLICQTDPTSGACLAPPAPSVATDIPPNATPTFGIFVTGSAPVADMPGVNRVFVGFTDAGGVLRGETSVAVRTQ
jgi:YVTN family beta-propeller protein